MFKIVFAVPIKNLLKIWKHFFDSWTNILKSLFNGCYKLNFFKTKIWTLFLYILRYTVRLKIIANLTWYDDIFQVSEFCSHPTCINELHFSIRAYTYAYMQTAFEKEKDTICEHCLYYYIAYETLHAFFFKIVEIFLIN